METKKEALKDDINKLRIDLVPAECIEALAECLSYGAVKYKPNSWQGVHKDKHYAALMRHLLSWRKGIIIDKESNISHLKLAFSNLMFLVYGEINE